MSTPLAPWLVGWRISSPKSSRGAGESPDSTHGPHDASDPVLLSLVPLHRRPGERSAPVLCVTEPSLSSRASVSTGIQWDAVAALSQLLRNRIRTPSPAGPSGR
jgi:hypothetical protein